MNYRSVVIGGILVTALFCIMATIPVSDAESTNSLSVSYVGYDSDSCTLTIRGAADFETVHIGLYQGNSKLVEAFASVKNGSYTQSIYVADFGSADTLKVWNGSATVCETVQFVKVGTVDYDRNSKLLAVSGTAGDGAVHLGIFGSDGKKVYEFFATASGGEFSVKANLDGIAYDDYIVKAWNASTSMISQKAFELECPQYSVEFKNYDGTVLSKEIYDLGTEASKIVLPDEPVKTGEYWRYVFAGWDSEVADVTADAAYTAVFTEIPVHTIAESTYDPSTDCVTVSGTSGSDLVHIGIYSDGKKMTEACAAVKDNSYSVVISLSGMAFDTVKVWDASVSTVASSAISGITSVSYDNMTQVLTVDIAKNVSVKVEGASALAGKNVTAKAETVSADTKVSGTAYEITFEVEGKAYSGNMIITLPYTPVNGERPVVYYCHDGAEDKMEIVSYDNSSVTFKTSHNSVYVVSSEQVPESDDMMTLAAIAVVVILFIIGMLYFIRRAEKQAQ